MSHQVAILHGKPSLEKYENSPVDPSDDNWLPWLKHQLRLRGYNAQTPDIAKPYDPEYELIKDALFHLDPGMSAVGHSSGGAALLRFGSEMKWIGFNKMVVVGPWLDLDNKYPGFGRFEVDPKLPERCAGGLAVWYSSDDSQRALDSLEVIQASLPDIEYRDFETYGHFMIDDNMDSPEFPELLEHLAA